MTDRLAAVETGLDRPVMAEAEALARHLMATHGESVAAVLFYGSCLRDATPEGVLDFYLLVDDYRVFHRSRFAAWANAVLPPTVRFMELDGVAAKVAVISTRAFARRMRPESLDTTLWARFCQPVALIAARDARARTAAVGAVATAQETAAGWARGLGPEDGDPAALWEALFRHTYAAELRVERRGDRARTIHAKAPAHFDAILVSTDPADASDRAAARRAWRWRVLAGKPLNLIRVVKGAFTFDGAADYIAWKVERHSGRKLALTPFQRRHPLIAAPRGSSGDCSGIAWCVRKAALQARIRGRRPPGRQAEAGPAHGPALSLTRRTDVGEIWLLQGGPHSRHCADPRTGAAKAPSNARRAPPTPNENGTPKGAAMRRPSVPGHSAAASSACGIALRPRPTFTKVAMASSICISEWAALIEQRSSGLPSGVAVERTRLQ